jgi:hypothetical protein
MAYTSINKPSDYFNVVTWTGTSDSTTAVTGVGHQPDWVWIKNRGVADDHMVYDAIRGGTKRIFTNSNGAEGTESQGIQSFDSDGFTTGTHRATGGDSGNTMVSWNWKGANGTASNGDGSTTSTVSANTTAGFSIVSYTGAGATTYGHGLGATPNVIIIKKRTSDTGNNNWFVYHDKVITASATNKSFMTLNTTDTLGTNGSATTFTSVSSTTFGVGTDDIISESSHTFIAYCFAEKKGYSKFGSYTGNLNADGKFVYTGFSPAWIMIKRTDGGTNDWILYDTKRCINGVENALEPNNSNTESTVIAKTDYNIDLLSNGFKPRSDSDQINNGSYIYMAFAEHPFVSSTGTPTTAR